MFRMKNRVNIVIGLVSTAVFILISGSAFAGTCKNFGFEHVIVKNDNGNFVGENKTSVCYEIVEKQSMGDGEINVSKGILYDLKQNNEKRCFATGMAFLSCKDNFECGDCMNTLNCSKEGVIYTYDNRFNHYQYTDADGNIIAKDCENSNSDEFCGVCESISDKSKMYVAVTCNNGKWEH